MASRPLRTIAPEKKAEYVALILATGMIHADFLYTKRLVSCGNGPRWKLSPKLHYRRHTYRLRVYRTKERCRVAWKLAFFEWLAKPIQFWRDNGIDWPVGGLNNQSDL